MAKKFIVGVTACQIGIAHTFMAAESLTKAIEARGCEAKIETQGATGAENVITDEDLARADARAVARAEVAGQVRIVAQGHHAARGRDAAAADDDRAVMQGRIFEKQVAQQLLGQLRVDDGAGFKVFVERRLAFEHEQHADALARHELAGLHGGVDGALLEGGGGLGGRQGERRLCADGG